VKENAVEDKWLILDIDTNALEPEISLKHNFNPVANTETYANKNDNTTEGGNNFGNNDILNLYTPIVDGMGHIVGHNIEHVTLPYSYRFIKSKELINDSTSDLYTKSLEPDNGDAKSEASLNDKELSENSTAASSTTDTLSIDPKNKWI
jgi:hypothetical protein